MERERDHENVMFGGRVRGREREREREREHKNVSVDLLSFSSTVQFNGSSSIFVCISERNQLLRRGHEYEIYNLSQAITFAVNCR